MAIKALDMFVEQGIENVTMDQVASSLSISRSSLFRIFPSKAALVWGGLNDFNRFLMSELAETGGGTPIKKLHTALVRTMADIADDTDTIRLRLKIIAASPEVLGWGQGQYFDTQGRLTEQLNILNGGDELRNAMLVSAMFSASFAALIWWATTDDPRSLVDFLDQSVTQFENTFGPAR